MAKDKTKINNDKISELERQIQDLKAQKKEIEQKFTYKGFYSKVIGRKSTLKHLKDNDKLEDAEKIVQAIGYLQSLINEYN